MVKVYLAPENIEARRDFARGDLADVDAADVVVVRADEQPGTYRPGRGKFVGEPEQIFDSLCGVEIGYALARGKPVILRVDNILQAISTINSMGCACGGNCGCG